VGKFIKGDIVVVPFPFSDLSAASNIRPNKLFTADGGIALYKIGTLKTDKLKAVIAKVIAIFSS